MTISIHMDLPSAIRSGTSFQARNGSVSSPDIQLDFNSDCLLSRNLHGVTGLRQIIHEPLTPPVDMNAIQTYPHPGFFPLEHGYHFAEQIPNQSTDTSSFDTLKAASSSDLSTASDIMSSRSSPIRSSAYDRCHRSLKESHQRQPSRASSTAADYQVPSNVHYSGEGIHELAAQITCLFWFESFDVLEQIEDSATIPPPQRTLAAEARPTSEFRKWVAHVLSTTRVADNVILLALLFIYRLKKQNSKVRGKAGSEYRLLTVALMLGNKFLDDNTYTNKTWAEVSRIDVKEVHIMEVEFLSNMKYCLSTSEEDWQHWRCLLGRFVAYYNLATRPAALTPILPLVSTLQVPRTLPSPPASNHASPPYAFSDFIPAPGVLSQHSLTPAPSPLPAFIENNACSMHSRSRKRSLDDTALESAPKRQSTMPSSHISPQRYSQVTAQQLQAHSVPRLPLPHLRLSAAAGMQTSVHLPQLPPLNVPARAMNMVLPTGTGHPHALPMNGPAPLSQPAPFVHRITQHQPIYDTGTAAPSPTSSMPASATALGPSTQVSPSYFLQQRSSPYRPVHQVSTLLHPPPSATLHARAGHVNLNQMQYQPLGKPVQHTGRLPYLAQNQWLDGDHPQEMTPVHQWPGLNYNLTGRPVV